MGASGAAAGTFTHPPVPLTELAVHIERLKANENFLFSQEYESIEAGQSFTWEHSTLEYNKIKNRYANVVAYDHSRVVLSKMEAIPGSDYINANYCDGYRRPKAYIATQGALPETFAGWLNFFLNFKHDFIIFSTRTIASTSLITSTSLFPLLIAVLGLGLESIINSKR